jgi:rubredoxin
MATKRELFKGGSELRWRCSACGWVFNPSGSPKITSPHLGAVTALQLEFNTHDCSAFPVEKKTTREDLNQAVARTIKEATEKY